MSLKAIYQEFLDSPNPLSLASNASLNYITTLTTFTEPGPIVKHLEVQNRMVVKKKAEKIIGAVVGHDSLSVDVETTLAFISGGGAYLPGMDGSFLVEKVTTLPMNHTVHFDHDNNIRQIRICWDQGSLLKQVDVIVSRGKSWPIFDGKDQSRLIANGCADSPPLAVPVQRGRDRDEVVVISRNASPNKKHVKDPHASLDLFQKVEDVRRELRPNAVAPRVSARPVPRDDSEIFAAGREEVEPSPGKTASPEKEVASKGATGQNFKPSRLFENEPEKDSPALKKSNPAKYNHFHIGNEPEHDLSQHVDPKSSSQIPTRPKSQKHATTWDFGDFDTPEKPRQNIPSQDVRHFGGGGVETNIVSHATEGISKAGKSRRDAETHFEFQEDGTPGLVPHAGGPAKGTQHNNGLGLYQNNLFNESDVIGRTSQEPLKPVTENIGRKNNLGSHWTMVDTLTTNDQSNNENKPLASDRAKAVKMMGASWDSYDQSPEQNKKAPKAKPLRKGMESSWGFGDEKTGSTENVDKSFWDF